jgi:hypothetical protein
MRLWLPSEMAGFVTTGSIGSYMFQDATRRSTSFAPSRLTSLMASGIWCGCCFAGAISRKESRHARGMMREYVRAGVRPQRQASRSGGDVTAGKRTRFRRAIPGTELVGVVADRGPTARGASVGTRPQARTESRERLLALWCSRSPDQRPEVVSACSGAACPPAAASTASASLRVTVKVLPTPFSLFTMASPPYICASLRTVDRPRPLPRIL